jgi:hypothetical protein
MPWYSAHASLGELLVGRQIGLFHLVCYVRDGDRVFENLLDETPQGGGHGLQLRAHGPHRVRTPGAVGGLAPPAGRNSAPSRGLTAARPTGHQCQCGRVDAPSPSGRDLKLDALTTSPWGPDRLPLHRRGVSHWPRRPRPRTDAALTGNERKGLRAGVQSLARPNTAGPVGSARRIHPLEQAPPAVLLNSLF